MFDFDAACVALAAWPETDCACPAEVALTRNMNEFEKKFALVIGVAVFAGGSLGLILHRVLPEKHVTGGGKDMVGAVVGLFTLLSALVLGLLIWTAYGVYAGQNVAIQTLAAKVLQLDLALSDYGPETKDVRAQLRQEFRQDHRRGLGRE